MLITNLDVEDRLINDQIGTVVKIEANRVSSKPEVVYVKFDDQNAGKERIRKFGDTYAITNGVVPVTSILGKIKVKKKIHNHLLKFKELSFLLLLLGLVQCIKLKV